MILVNGMSRSTKRIFGSIGMDDVEMGLEIWKFGLHLYSNQFFIDLILNPLETLMKKSYGWWGVTRTLL